MSDSLASRWEQYHESGRRAMSQGSLAEADQAFQAAVHEAELLGPEDAHLATSLTALGQLRTQSKDYAAAESFLVRALALRERAFGPEGHPLVPTLNALAALHESRAEYDRAESALRRALGISEHHLGPIHPEVSVGLNSLAKLYFKRRDFAKADRLLLRLLEIKRGLGKDHPEVATVLGSLAKLRQVVGKHDQGEQLWRQALAVRERTFAPNDPVIAMTLENLADCCAAIPGRVSEAVALRERAMSIRESVPNANVAAIANARAKLSELRTRERADSSVAPEPPPRRGSKELPAPLISDEVPVYLSGEGPPRRPSTDLPWLDLEDSDRLSAPLYVQPPPTAPISRRRTPAASVTPLGVPRQGGTALPPTAFIAPMVPGGDLQLSDSIAPEPPGRESPSGRAARYVAPHDPRATASGRGARYVAPDPDSTRSVARPRTPRLPAEMSRRGSSKRLVVAGAVIIALAAAGWFARGELAAAGVPFLDDVAQGASKVLVSARAQARAKSRHEVPASHVDSAARAVSAPRTPIVTSIPAAQGKPAPDTIRPGATTPAQSSTQIAAADARAARSAAEGQAAQRDSIGRAKRAVADDGLQLKRVPNVGDQTALDAITNDVERATKPKVESAQAQIVDKAPIFKKP